MATGATSIAESADRFYGDCMAQVTCPFGNFWTIFIHLTNAFSKKFANHCYAQALYFVWYNFCRKHRTIGTTPAIAAGLADRSYDMRWIVEMINERTPLLKRGPYRKRQR